MGLARSGRSVISLVLTFHVVCLAWILFRSPDFATAWTYLTATATLSDPVQLLTPFLAALIAFGLAMHALPPRGIEQLAGIMSRLRSPSIAALAVLAFILIDTLRPPGVAPFIYFQF